MRFHVDVVTSTVALAARPGLSSALLRGDRSRHLVLTVRRRSPADHTKGTP